MAFVSIKFWDNGDLLKLVSITSSITSHNRKIFENWRKRVGNEEAIVLQEELLVRGTDMHTLVEKYLYNEELPQVQPLSDILFKLAS